MLGSNLGGWGEVGEREGGRLKQILKQHCKAIMFQVNKESSAANQSKGLVVYKPTWMDFRNKILKVKTKRQNEIFNIYHLPKLKYMHTKGS